MDRLASKLIDEYIKACKKRNHFKIAISKEDDTHKNYKYFEKLAEMYSRVPGFDAYTFIEANLQDEVRYPAQLTTKTAFKRFQDYKERLQAKERGEKNKDEIIIQSFKNSVQIITDKMGKYDPEGFFNSEKSPGFALFMKGLISHHYCMVCKPFWNMIKTMEEDVKQLLDIEELQTKRAYVLNVGSTVLTKLKKIMKDEYWI